MTFDVASVMKYAYDYIIHISIKVVISHRLRFSSTSCIYCRFSPLTTFFASVYSIPA